MRADEIRAILQSVGFTDIAVLPKALSASYEQKWHRGMALTQYVGAALIKAHKPTC